MLFSGAESRVDFACAVRDLTMTDNFRGACKVNRAWGPSRPTKASRRLFRLDSGYLWCTARFYTRPATLSGVSQ